MKNIIIIGISLIIFVGCKSENNQAATLEKKEIETSVILSAAQLKNAGIVIAKMELREISTILKVNGKIDVPPQNMVSVSVPLGGYLKSTKLLPGMHINKGDIIAVMEDQQYIQLQQDFLMAKAKIDFLENEYKRQKELNQSQASSDKVYQLAEADYRTNRVLMTALATKLQLIGINSNQISETNIFKGINIYSPIDGFVSKVNVNIGKYVSSTDILFELINPDDIHLNLKIFEKNLDKIFIGQPLVTYTNNHPNKKYPCEIILIGKDVSIEGNTEVHCHFEVYDKTLVPGTYMNAEIEVKNSKAKTLPSDAIVRFEGKQFVFKSLSNQHFEMIEVTLGESENGFTEINFNDNTTMPDANFVTKGAYSLLMVMKNKVE